MQEFSIQLCAGEDGAVSIAASCNSQKWEHVAPAEAVTALHRQLEQFQSLFGSGHRPLADRIALAELGTSLCDTFLQPFYHAITELTDGHSRRLLFSSSDSVCLNLPWELLPGADGGFLVADARYAIRRSVRQTLLPAASGPAAPPLRILFMACAPLDLTGLDYEKEEEAILRIVHKLGAKVHLEVAEAGTFDELHDLIIEHRPHIVHLSGHASVDAGVGSFAFENERGQLDSRNAREVAAQLFAGTGVRLVFVNGCETAQAATAGVCQTLTATGHVPLALGWGASIADDLATEFAREVFHIVAAGQPIDQAVAAARVALLQRGTIREGNIELLDASFALPQLYAAEGVDALVDHQRTPDAPPRPGVSYQLLGDNIRGLREGFVGRRRQLQRTRPALHSGEKNIVLLTGIGGAGKSTLATRLANRCAQDGFRIVAVQARREEAAQFGLRLVTELAKACQRMGRGSDEQMLLDGKRPLGYRLELAVEVLNEAKILLVLDNLEALMPAPPATHTWESPDVTAFFTALTSRLTGQGRAILTCRYLPQGLDPAQPNLAHEPMPDFTEADFFKYLRRHPTVFKRIDNGELSRQLIETFYRKLGATPRFVEQASAILGTLEADRLEEQLESLAAPAQGSSGDDLWRLQQKYFRDLFLPQLYESLSEPYRLALCRLAAVQEALPSDGVAQVSGLDSADEFLGQCVGRSLLQRFGESGEVDLFAIYPLQRDFFTDPLRLPEEAHREAHLAAAAFFRECYESDREEDLRISFMAELFTCLYHFTAADDLGGQIWAVDKIARPLIRHAEYGRALDLVSPFLEKARHIDLLAIAARCALDTGEWKRARELYSEEIKSRTDSSDRQGEADVWHNLGTIEMHEGNIPAARDNFAKSLSIRQIIGDRSGEAATWHNLAAIEILEGRYTAAREYFAKTLSIMKIIGNEVGEAATWHGLASIDLNEGNYSAARDNFAKSLSIKQAIGDRAGEAATWHQLATIDSREGNYSAARDKLAKSLFISQAIGDRASEATTLFQLGSVSWNAGRREIGIQIVAACFVIEKSIGSGGINETIESGLVPMAFELQLNEAQLRETIAAAAKHYQHDRCATLVKQAFDGW